MGWYASWSRELKHGMFGRKVVACLMPSVPALMIQEQHLPERDETALTFAGLQVPAFIDWIPPFQALTPVRTQVEHVASCLLNVGRIFNFQKLQTWNMDCSSSTNAPPSSGHVWFKMYSMWCTYFGLVETSYVSPSLTTEIEEIPQPKHMPLLFLMKAVKSCNASVVYNDLYFTKDRWHHHSSDPSHSLPQVYYRRKGLSWKCATFHWHRTHLLGQIASMKWDLDGKEGNDGQEILEFGTKCHSKSMICRR